MSKTLIKMYYRMGIYSDADLETFVNAGYITSEEMKEIIDVQEIKNV